MDLSDDHLAVGSAVRLNGLVSQPALNGIHGRVISYDSAKARYGVAILDKKVTKQLALQFTRLYDRGSRAEPEVSARAIMHLKGTRDTLSLEISSGRCES